MTGNHLTHSPEETRALAGHLAVQLRGGAVLLLEGDLGMGKTCFVQGLVAALGCDAPVTSPTYALVQEYAATPPLAHADLYRLSGAQAVWDLGLDEMWEAGWIVAVEWSTRAPDMWPDDAWHIAFASGEGEEDRVVTISRGESV